MPVKRDAAAAVETPAQRLARFATEDMLERADRTAEVGHVTRARMVELIQLDRDLEPDEQAEFDRFIKRRDKRRRQSQRFAALVDRRQAKHPDETRGESALAVALAASEKRRQRDERREERHAAAERVLEQERAEAAALVAREPEREIVATHTAPAFLEPEVEAAPRRPRIKAGLVAQYDAQGRRVQ